MGSAVTPDPASAAICSVSRRTAGQQGAAAVRPSRLTSGGRRPPPSSAARTGSGQSRMGAFSALAATAARVVHAPCGVRHQDTAPRPRRSPGRGGLAHHRRRPVVHRAHAALAR